MQIMESDMNADHKDISPAVVEAVEETVDVQTATCTNVEEFFSRLRNQDLPCAQDLNLSNPLFQSASGAEKMKLLLKYVRLAQVLLAKRAATKGSSKSESYTPGYATENSNSSQNLPFQKECSHDDRSNDNSTVSSFDRLNFDFLQSAEDNTTVNTTTSQPQGGDNSYVPDHPPVQNILQASTLPYNTTGNTAALQSNSQPTFDSGIQVQHRKVDEEENTGASWENTTEFDVTNQMLQQNLINSLGMPELNGLLKSLQQNNAKLCRKYDDTCDQSGIPNKMLKVKDTREISEQSGTSNYLSSSSTVTKPLECNAKSNSEFVYTKSSMQKSVVSSSPLQVLPQQYRGSTSPSQFQKIPANSFCQATVVPKNSQVTSSGINSIITDLSSGHSNNFNTLPNSVSEVKAQNKSKRYYKTAEALNRSGLMDVTTKTAELLQKNRRLQKQIDELKKESMLFMTDVLQNPENEGIRDKIRQLQSLNKQA